MAIIDDDLEDPPEVLLILYKFLGRIDDVPGWASLLVSVLFLSGVQLLSIGIVGEYIARIYDEVKQRPEYIVNRTVGFAEGGGHVGLGG